MNSSERQMIPIKFKHKEEIVQESLFNLCLKYIVKNLDVICTQNNIQGHRLHEGLVLPSEICDAFLETYQNNVGTNFDSVARLFEDVTKTKLRSIHIHHSNISDHGLKYLLRHNLYEISLTMCHNLTQKTYMNIFKYAINLRSLTIGPYVRIIPLMNVSNSSETLNSMPCITPSTRFSVEAPNLKHLVIRGIAESPHTRDGVFLNDMLDKFLLLRKLDLSYCLSVGNLEYLSKLTNLHTLILFDVPHLQENNAFVNICLLQSLVILDLSQTRTNPHQGVYKDENKTLALIVKSLPKLMYLDISGTNLAGKGIAEHTMRESLSGKKSDITGLECRVNNPLEFLGLYHTMHNACQRHDIPANIISGNANIDQILNAAASCMDKPKLLVNILIDLSFLLGNEQCTQIDQALDIVLEVLTIHIKEKPIQIAGSATLYFIVKNIDRSLLKDITVIRRIITTLLNGMNSHINDKSMMRNGCLILCQLRIPQDVMFMFRSLVHILLHIVSNSDHEEFVHRIGIHLLNAVAYQVNNIQKIYLGDAGTIKKMLVIIENRLHRRLCDEVLEDAWSTMWNVTDETPINCKRFLKRQGMKYFLQCVKTFPDKNELICNMMGLLGNVAEVKELRPKLMKTSFIEVLSELLYSSQNGIEVGYNAAGIIAHLASDGNEAWVIKSPSRSKILERMTEAIQTWNLDTDRKINYCSLKPLFQLAQVKHTPQCQHWAVWALANLTKVYPERYCSIIQAEGGLKILSELLDEPSIDNQNNPPGVILSLVQTIVNQCLAYMEITVEQSPQENQ